MKNTKKIYGNFKCKLTLEIDKKIAPRIKKEDIELRVISLTNGVKVANMY